MWLALLRISRVRFTPGRRRRAPSSRARAFQAIPMTKFKTSRRSDSSARSRVARESKVGRRGRGGELVFGVPGPGRESIRETLLHASDLAFRIASRATHRRRGWGKRSEFFPPPFFPSYAPAPRTRARLCENFRNFSKGRRKILAFSSGLRVTSLLRGFFLSLFFLSFFFFSFFFFLSFFLGILDEGSDEPSGSFSTRKYSSRASM